MWKELLNTCQGIIFTTKIQALERSEKQMRYKNGENEL